MTYRTKFWLLGALAFGSSLVVGVIIGKSVPSTSGVENPALVLPALFGIITLLFIPVWLWWKKTDDLQREGQMVSWWWGGTFGALVAIVALVVLTGRHSDMSLGAMYLFLAEFAGMAVVWVGWKLRGLGPAE